MYLGLVNLTPVQFHDEMSKITLTDKIKYQQDCACLGHWLLAGWLACIAS